MKVRIYQKAKNINQSGAGSNKWAIEFLSAPNSKSLNSVMGWTSSSDMMQELALSFPDKISAINFAQANDWKFEEIAPAVRKIIKKSYADNFK